MDIGAITSAPSPQSAAVNGMQEAQAQMAAAAETIAAGRLEPAVILDITSAELNFAANAKVLQAADDNTKRLLDVLA
ncbi:hypothetical protein HL658_35105 [Azospirillum sp. RWY-5-1]|uniref:Flagellar basal-body/hook protein C-terminal domain-containing protein n=1 Tax=Azospirillum oleiclasticum TaxID=2735135 RepID=A0ABX2TE03_9PROT|nr:hypothetical protein [Azospirillum oleiclasticum]NYZ17801.1 hypothetical protein [Azospirillum oleiclasticum]NYZ21442.1 hypothetical protein [Azospirillum oleiclasticum]